MKTCIQTLVLNEQLYIKEWVDYHLSLGFDDIFIFEDHSSESHKYIFEDYGNVHIQSIEDIQDILPEWYNSCKGQIRLMKWFLNKLKEDNIYDWCLFSDCDEFLMFDEGYDLNRLLNEFDDYSGIWLAWKMYNANWHIKRPDGNVIDNYTNIIEFDDNKGIDGNKMFNKKSFVNIHKASNSFKNNHIINDGVDTEFNDDPNVEKTYSKAWLNHYFSKSFEDFCDRMLNRGNMKNSNRSFDQFFKVNPELKHKEQELINSVRFKYNNPDTQYISHKRKIISGGNLSVIQKLLK